MVVLAEVWSFWEAEMGQHGLIGLTPKELQRAARVAAKFEVLKIDEMRRRTERRIDYAEPAPRAVVVALTYVLVGAFAPIPVAVVMPMLRPATLLLMVLGVFVILFLRTARTRLNEHYSRHSSWRILARASNAARQLSP